MFTHYCIIIAFIRYGKFHRPSVDSCKEISLFSFLHLFSVALSLSTYQVCIAGGDIMESINKLMLRFVKVMKKRYTFVWMFHKSGLQFVSSAPLLPYASEKERKRKKRWKLHSMVFMFQFHGAWNCAHKTSSTAQQSAQTHTHEHVECGWGGRLAMQSVRALHTQTSALRTVPKSALVQSAYIFFPRDTRDPISPC